MDNVFCTGFFFIKRIEALCCNPVPLLGYGSESLLTWGLLFSFLKDDAVFALLEEVAGVGTPLCEALDCLVRIDSASD